MHLRLFSDELETATEGGSEALSSRSFKFSGKESPIHVQYLTELSPPQEDIAFPTT